MLSTLLRSDDTADPRRRIAKMFLSLTAIAVTERLIFFVSMIYTRRTLGAEAIGQISWSAAVIAYFALVLNPGLETIARREVAKSAAAAGRYAVGMVSLQLLMAVLLFITIAVMASFNPRGPVITKLLLIQGMALLITPFDLMWLAQARERTAVVAMMNVVLQLVQIPVFVLMLHRPEDVLWFAFIPLPFRAALVIATAVYCFRHKLLRVVDMRATAAQVKQLVVEAWPIGLSQAAVLLYYNTDAIILGIYKGDAEVGLYATAYRLMLVPTFIFAAAHPSFFPSLARAGDNPDEAKSVSSGFLKFHAWMGCAVAALTWAIGRFVLTAMYGKGYAAEGRLYEWLSLNLPLIFLNVGLIMPLTAWGRQKLQFKITLAAAVLNVGLNFLLIPHYGASAAVITTLMSEGLVFGCGCYIRSRQVHPIPWPRLIAPPVAVAVLVGLPMKLWVTAWPGGWVLIAMLGTVAMAAAYAKLEGVALPVPTLGRFFRPASRETNAQAASTAVLTSVVETVNP